MPSSKDQRLFDRLAAATRRDIRADKKRVAAELKSTLDEISQRLFDPSLAREVERKLARKRLLQRFFFAFDGLPRHYLRRHRLAIVSDLLQRTDLKLGEIASWTGYPNSSVLGRDFKEEFEVSPAHFRRYGPGGRFAARLTASKAGKRAAESARCWPPLAPQQLPAPQVVADLIGQMFAQVDSPRKAVLERGLAELWEEIDKLPESEQPYFVHEFLVLPLIFTCLQRLIREAADIDPQHELLLIDEAERFAQDMGFRHIEPEGNVEARARFWIWLGFRRLQHDDPTGCSRAIQIAEILMEERPDPRLQGEAQTAQDLSRLLSSKQRDRGDEADERSFIPFPLLEPF